MPSHLVGNCICIVRPRIPAVLLFVLLLFKVFIVTFSKAVFSPFSLWRHEIPRRNSSAYEATTMHGLVAGGYDRIMWLACIVRFIFMRTWVT